MISLRWLWLYRKVMRFKLRLAEERLLNLMKETKKQKKKVNELEKELSMEKRLNEGLRLSEKARLFRNS